MSLLRRRANIRRAIEGLEPRWALTLQFGVIGDYGVDNSNELAVANLVKSWNPDFVLTVGDNNYDVGAAATIDRNIGKYYQEFIGNYVGTFGPGSPTNRFWPSLGNHDWGTPGAQPYLEYFTLPGNERYYDFVQGNVHFFAIDSDPNEPDGRASNSTQGQWLQQRLAASTSEFQIVYFHHPPYSSSSTHGSDPQMQWPFREWGADVVLAGHDHTYERLFVDGLPYFVDGLGGRSIYAFGSPVLGSQFRYNANYGAMRVTADTGSILFEFFSITGGGTLIDSFTLTSASQPALSIGDVTVTEGNSGTVDATFTVSLSAASSQTVTVEYTTANGTATAGADYTAIPTMLLSFAPGITSRTVTVSVNGDSLDEASETFFVDLSNAVGATISEARGVGTINNDDASSGLSIVDVAVVEGTSGTTTAATFNVLLSAASGQVVTVNYSTSNGSARSGKDFVGVSNAVLAFQPGETSRTIAVFVKGDKSVEPDETFFVNLSSPVGATLNDGQGVGTIRNDDVGRGGAASTEAAAADAALATISADFAPALADLPRLGASRSMSNRVDLVLDRLNSRQINAPFSATFRSRRTSTQYRAPVERATMGESF